MIYRIFPTKDTVITNDVRSNARMTGSNVGAAEALEVFKGSAISGTIGTLGSSSLARTLMQFDVNAVAALTASGEAPSTGISYKLRLVHKTSDSELPYSFDLTVAPLSRSWDEGRGVDDVDLLDVGVANWDKATSSTFWTTPGGDFLSTTTSSVHFDTGYEDLESDIGPMFRAWLTGNLPNNGLIVRMTSSIEADSVYEDYRTKKFYSRTSNYRDRRPYVELSWNDFVADDRSNMRWGRTGSLALYNIVGGQMTNLSANPIVDIKHASGTIVSVTASYSGLTGIYSATFALASGTTYSGSIFYDGWRLNGQSLMTGTFVLTTDGATTDADPPQLTAKVRNLKNEYTGDEVVRFDVMFRKKGTILPFLSTASMAPKPYITRKAFYAIENDSTAFQAVPFGTGSDEVTRLSYDGNGNYFKFYMRNLHAGNLYRIIFLVDENGYKQTIDSGFRFKVV